MPDTLTLPQQLRSLDADRLRRYAETWRSTAATSGRRR